MENFRHLKCHFSERQQKILLKIVLVLTVLIIISPFLIATVFSFPIADDFSMTADAIEIAPYSSRLLSAFSYTKHMYNTWNGTYSPIFFFVLINPLVNGGLITIRIILFLSFTLFAISIFVFFFTFLKYLGIKKIAYIFALFFIIVFFSYKTYYECYYWLTSNLTYLIGLSCGLNTISFLILYLENRKRKFLVFSIILAIIMCGASLEVVGLIDYLILFLLIHAFFFNRANTKPIAITFSVAIVFALIQCAAPGNSIRHELLISAYYSINMVECLIRSVIFTIKEVYALLIVNNYWFLYLIYIFILYRTDVKLSNKSILLLLIIVLLPIITIFPVIYGYGGAIDTYFPNRVSLAFDFSVILVGFFLSTIVASIIATYSRNKITFSLHCVLSLLLFFIYVSLNFQNFEFLKMTNNLLSGNLQKYSNDVTSIFDTIENSTDSTVIIKKTLDPVYGYEQFSLGDNCSSNWINIAVANYYKKDCVILINDD